MAGKGVRTYEYKKPNPGSARAEQYIYVHPQLDRAVQRGVLERDGQRCQFSLALLPGFQPENFGWRYRRCGGALHVNHLRRLEDGGTDDLSNLTTLCKRHHSLVHQMLRAIARAESQRA